MGLHKSIRLDGGVPCKYHRVASVDIVTNELNAIHVISYLDESYRTKEQEAITASLESGEAIHHDIFTAGRYYAAPYDQNMTVEGAYVWLKGNVSEFKNATDVLEEDDE